MDDPGSQPTLRIHGPDASAGTPGLAPLAEPGKPSVLTSFQNLILVVDDEPQIRDMTAAMLTRMGYHVVTAGDGVRALAAFAAHADDVRLVIADVIIPKLDGVTLCRVIREMSPNVRILAMSGLSNTSSPAPMEGLADAFLYKPFKVQALVEAVRRLMQAP